jgi:glucose/arabinose dehydrogenase/cytochrome c5
MTTYSFIRLAAVLSFGLCQCHSPSEKNELSEADDFDTPRIVDSLPSPGYLSAEQSLKTFRMPSGYHLELVADESMITEPVAIAWDGNARMFVCQMETYMQSVDTTGEHMHESRILMLEDTDNDGKMDKRTEFIKGLMLPRMILCVGHELLVNETDTYDIIAYEDSDGDGVADQKRTVYHTDRKPFGNLEHQRSGLDWNLDNYIYVTVDPVRYRFKDGVLKMDSLFSGSNGQWGLTHDNYGRLYFSRAGAENAGSGFQINPVYGQLDFKDVYVDSIFGAVWPIVKTVDVQGGLKRLRKDTTLNHFTAANGQLIFRGDQLPKSLIGDYLINEPVARIVRRAKVIPKNGKRTLENAYHEEEFIASSDMNFRPVNAYTGPDGCLYIVDMNRGIIQEGQWTGKGSYLRAQILKLGLEKNIQHGRIFRLVHDGFTRGPRPHLLDEPTIKLITYLDHPNGWWRDNAQKEIVVRGDHSVVDDLKQIARGKQGPLDIEPTPLGRLHALWTLEGLNSIDVPLILEALNDEDLNVRVAAIRLSETFVKNAEPSIIEALLELKNDDSIDVRIQLVLSLSQGRSAKARELVTELVSANPENEIIAALPKVIQRNDDLKHFGYRMGGMDPAGRKLVLEGANIFKTLCATCHGEDGKGIPTQVAPPLASAHFDRLMKNKEGMIRILLNGLTGPVDGKNYSQDMVSMGMNNDEWIASVLSYVRYNLGTTERNFYWPPSKDFVAGVLVTPQEVHAIRSQTAARNKPWTWTELEKIKK